MSELVRIGARLFNLNHVTTIEPGVEDKQSVVDIHIVQGRMVRLRGDDARAALNLVDSYSPFPSELPGEEPPPCEDRSDREVVDEDYRERADDARGWTVIP
jgi:hypothetical protein